MKTVFSKLTSKYQATIPEPVRKRLLLEAGDSISFDIEDERICVRKTQPVDMAFTHSLEGILTEWSSPFDEEAYRDL